VKKTAVSNSAVNVRSLGYAVLVHLACVAVVFLGLFWTETAKPLSVAGPIIEATLVDFKAAPLPAVKTPPKPARPAPPKAAPPKPPEPKPVVEEVPREVTPRSEDRVDQEEVRIRAEALEQAEKEQEEKIRKRQIDLTEPPPEDELARMEAERQQQIEDIRRQREAAEQKTQLEERALAQMQTQNKQAEIDRQRALEQQKIAQMAAQEAEREGNEGESDALLDRYRLAISNQVDRNWSRPDTMAQGFRCTASVTQIIGGEVIGIDLSRCQGDAETLRSVEAAVMRERLPYRGFETVFSRQLQIPFCFPRELCIR
jgi:colicin import membrane protein